MLSKLPSKRIRKGKEERRALRQQRKARTQQQAEASPAAPSFARSKEDGREQLMQYLSENQSELLQFVVKVNKLYEEKLKKSAPFMTFVLIGMQSSGKSTFMERLLNAVLNIVQEGTGTRCPLDVTCIYDPLCAEAIADLSGEELDEPGNDLCGLSV